MKCRKIPGFKTKYVISKNGDIFRIVSGGYRRVKPATNEDGYKTVVLYKNSKPYFRYVHNLVADVWLDGNKDSIVNHKDGDKNNNSANNLEYVNHGQNTQHAYDKGLAKGARGENNGMSKLSNSDVSKIKKSKKSGIELAKQYRVTPAAISMIRSGKRR